LKIVLIGPAYPLRGGNALFIAHLYEALARTNDVHVISFSRLYPQFLFPGVRQNDVSTVALKSHPAERTIDSLNPFTWVKAGRRASELRPDLLVFTWWNPFFAFVVRTIAAEFKSKTGKPVVIVAENVVSHEGRWIDFWLTKFALSVADRFLVLSQVVEKQVNQLFPSIKVFRSTLPVYDCYAAPQQLTQAEAQAKLGLSGKKVVLFFGYVRQYKGLMNLIEAMPIVRKEIPNAHLLVVGEFYDDPKPYRDAIARLGLSDAVTIVAEYVPNEEVHRYYSAANVVVLPYNEATQSGILSIAFGFAKPVIATNVGGLAELIDDGATGYVVPPHDSTALALAIVKYFREERETEFSAAVGKKAEQNSFVKIREVFEEISRDLQSASDNRQSNNRE
jgi:glycosyltransferase involved in cell wall biosynthesis